jgi:hypothetical protein
MEAIEIYFVQFIDHSKSVLGHKLKILDKSLLLLRIPIAVE